MKITIIEPLNSLLKNPKKALCFVYLSWLSVLYAAEQQSSVQQTAEKSFTPVAAPIQTDAIAKENAASLSLIERSPFMPKTFVSQSTSVSSAESSSASSQSITSNGVIVFEKDGQKKVLWSTKNDATGKLMWYDSNYNVYNPRDHSGALNGQKISLQRKNTGQAGSSGTQTLPSNTGNASSLLDGEDDFDDEDLSFLEAYKKALGGHFDK